SDCSLPATDDGIDCTVHVAGELLTPAEGKVINAVCAEVLQGVDGATAVVCLRIVLVLEEVLRGLGLRLTGAFFIAVRTEVAKRVGHALGPGVAGLEVKPVVVLLGDGGFEGVE